jgi:hypothetical protein
MSRRIQHVARASIAGAFVAAGLAAVACQTAPDGSIGYAKQAASPPEWDVQYDVPHYDDTPMPTYFRFDSVADPWTSVDIATCQAFTSPETPANSQPYRDCVCTNCLDLVHQCDALVGCREILACGARVGCADTTSCYIAPANGTGCQAEIDKWGNSGFAAYLAATLQTCAQSNSCPLPF